MFLTMKKTIYILLLALLYLSCRSAGEKTIAGEGVVDDLKVKGYTQFTIGEIVTFDAGASKFQKIRLILENPVEYVWEDVSLKPGAKPELLKQKYINRSSKKMILN